MDAAVCAELGDYEVVEEVVEEEADDDVIEISMESKHSGSADAATPAVKAGAKVAAKAAASPAKAVAAKAASAPVKAAAAEEVKEAGEEAKAAARGGAPLGSKHTRYTRLWLPNADLAVNEATLGVAPESVLGVLVQNFGHLFEVTRAPKVGSDKSDRFVLVLFCACVLCLVCLLRCFGACVFSDMVFVVSC